MPNYVPVSKENHASKRWKRFDSYSFASREAISPLVAAELPKAVTAFPIAFIQQAETFFPAALLGFEQGRNLFVSAKGQWVGAYVPSALRGHPFKLGRSGDGKLFLCVDEESELITDGPDGEPLLDDTGSPTEQVKEVMHFLQQIELNSQATAQACAVLAKHNLIKTWPLTLKTPEGEKTIQGLFQIDEQALNSLPDEAFLELRKSGALPMAYCQMLSMQHVATLGKLAEAHAQAVSQMAQQNQPFQTSIEFDDDMIKFT